MYCVVLYYIVCNLCAWPHNIMGLVRFSISNTVLCLITDDDSVIIGAWFEEPSTPGEGGDDPASGGAQGNSDSSSSPDDSQAKTPHRHNSEVTTIVPEKGEPHGVSLVFQCIYVNEKLLLIA